MDYYELVEVVGRPEAVGTTWMCVSVICVIEKLKMIQEIDLFWERGNTLINR